MRPGEQLPELRVRITRPDLVRYAGASGDFNEIHWRERAAVAVGLPNVIAHGMLTMAHAIRAVTDALGDPGAVLSYEVRFTRPVLVPDDDEGALLVVNATVVEVSDGRARVELDASVDGVAVLGSAMAVVRSGQ